VQNDNRLLLLNTALHHWDLFLHHFCLFNGKE